MVPIHMPRGADHEDTIWRRFCGAMAQRVLANLPDPGLPRRCLPRDPLHEEILAELARYGAWTNWDDAEDPIWFPSQEARFRFVLDWG